MPRKKRNQRAKAPSLQRNPRQHKGSGIEEIPIAIGAIEQAQIYSNNQQDFLSPEQQTKLSLLLIILFQDMLVDHKGRKPALMIEGKWFYLNVSKLLPIPFSWNNNPVSSIEGFFFQYLKSDERFLDLKTVFDPKNPLSGTKAIEKYCSLINYFSENLFRKKILDVFHTNEVVGIVPRPEFIQFTDEQNEILLPTLVSHIYRKSHYFQSRLLLGGKVFTTLFKCVSELYGMRAEIVNSTIINNEIFLEGIIKKNVDFFIAPFILSTSSDVFRVVQGFDNESVELALIEQQAYLKLIRKLLKALLVQCENYFKNPNISVSKFRNTLIKYSDKFMKEDYFELLVDKKSLTKFTAIINTRKNIADNLQVELTNLAKSIGGLTLRDAQQIYDVEGLISKLEELNGLTKEIKVENNSAVEFSEKYFQSILEVFSQYRRSSPPIYSKGFSLFYNQYLLLHKGKDEFSKKIHQLMNMIYSFKSEVENFQSRLEKKPKPQTQFFEPIVEAAQAPELVTFAHGFVTEAIVFPVENNSNFSVLNIDDSSSTVYRFVGDKEQGLKYIGNLNAKAKLSANGEIFEAYVSYEYKAHNTESRTIFVTVPQDQADGRKQCLIAITELDHGLHTLKDRESFLESLKHKVFELQLPENRANLTL